MRGDRKCIVDAKQYNYCPHCRDNPDETWRYLFCSENCRDIYNVLESWVAKQITSEQAREQLNKYKLPPIDTIKTALRSNIEQIFKDTEDITPKVQPKKRGRKKKILVNED